MYDGEMAGPYDLVLLDGARAALRVPIREVPTYLGRAPDCTLSLDDPSVSWQHAIVWAAEDDVLIRDLKSRNGTFVDGDRIDGEVRLREGTSLTVGEVQLRVERGWPTHEGPMLRHLEQVDTGARVALAGPRLVLGSAASADVRLDGPSRAGVIVQHADGELWLGTPDGERPLELGEVFSVEGRRYRVVELQVGPRSTVPVDDELYPYRLTVSLDGPTGATATLLDRQTGASHVVRVENRAVLLYVLARAARADREARKPAFERGWLPEDEVVTGVWGRAGLTQGTNNLNVLLHRVRHELGKAGFDPWFIEKKKRALRLRLHDIQVD